MPWLLSNWNSISSKSGKPFRFQNHTNLSSSLLNTWKMFKEEVLPSKNKHTLFQIFLKSFIIYNTMASYFIDLTFTSCSSFLFLSFCFSAPSGLSSPRLYPENETTIQIEWDPPAQLNGPYPLYQVRALPYTQFNSILFIQRKNHNNSSVKVLYCIVKTLQ